MKAIGNWRDTSGRRRRCPTCATVGTVKDGTFIRITTNAANVLIRARSDGHSLRIGDQGQLKIQPRPDEDLHLELLRHKEAITSLVEHVTRNLWPIGIWVQIG